MEGWLRSSGRRRAAPPSRYEDGYRRSVLAAAAHHLYIDIRAVYYEEGKKPSELPTRRTTRLLECQEHLLLELASGLPWPRLPPSS